jgi:predicted permease
LGRSLANLKWSNVGFDRRNLAYASVHPGEAGYSAERLGPYVDRVRGELARLPGVVRVSPVKVRLLSGNAQISRVSIAGRPSYIEKGIVTPAQATSVNWVGVGFFETGGIPLVAGRTFENRDVHPGAEAVVVDELFAKRFFPNANPLGQRFGFDAKDSSRFQIIGVVGSSRYNTLRNEPLPVVYEPYLLDPRDTVHFAIRATIDSRALADEVRFAVASVDPSVPLTEFHAQNALIDRMLRTERLLAFLSGAYGLVALLLAAIGIGGVLAYSVACRTNEIGVRMALGAATKDVVKIVVGDSLKMAGVGLLLGLPCAYAVGQILKSSLFSLGALDPWTAASSFLILIVTAIVAA